MGKAGDSLVKVGEEALSPRGAPCREEVGWPMVKVVDAVVVVVVECYYYLKNNYC